MVADQGRRVRVLFHIVGFNNGGIESALIQWLRNFDRDRFEVSLSVMFRSPSWEQRFRAQIPKDVNVEILVDRPWLEQLELRRYRGRLGRFGRVSRDVFNTLAVHPYARKRLAALARRHDALIDFDLSLRQWMRDLGDVPSMGVSHFSFVARFGHRPRKVRRLAQQFRHYGRLVALNPEMAAEAPLLFGADLPHPFVLPNVIDIDAIRARARAPGASSSPCQAPYIVSVARLDELQKDHRTLLRAYAQLLREEPVREDLVIAGDGAFRQELEALAASLGIAARVHFVGHVDNPHGLISGARVFVLSSRNEGLPMGMLEALAHGKPVVATDCPTGPSDVLDHGRAGMLVPIGDPAAMAKALGRVLTDNALYRELCETANARARHYGAAASNRRLAECLEHLLDEHRAVNA